MTDEVKWLSQGPNEVARRFSGYIINGFRFHTKNRERNKKGQNSGVVISAKTSSFASARDKNPIVGDVTYYGALKDIIEVDYYGHFKVVLFKCDWVDVTSRGKGIKDDYGFTLVNFNRLLSTGQNMSDEPFIFASQAEQVFYVEDPVDKGWHVVIKTKPRDLYEMSDEIHPDDLEAYHESELYDGERMENDFIVTDEKLNWDRVDVDGITIEANIFDTQEMEPNQEDDCDDIDNDD